MRDFEVDSPVVLALSSLSVLLGVVLIRTKRRTVDKLLSEQQVSGSRDKPVIISDGDTNPLSALTLTPGPLLLRSSFGWAGFTGNAVAQTIHVQGKTIQPDALDNGAVAAYEGRHSGERWTFSGPDRFAISVVFMENTSPPAFSTINASGSIGQQLTITASGNYGFLLSQDTNLVEYVRITPQGAVTGRISSVQQAGGQPHSPTPNTKTWVEICVA